MRHPTNMLARTEGRQRTAAKVEAQTDRFGDALSFLNWRFDCKVSARDTDGAFCVYDTSRMARGGPPLHIHRDQDEWFYVREGEFVVKVGEETVHLKPGDSLLAPRGIPHAFSSLTDMGRLLIVFQPAGTMEQLFGEVNEFCRSSSPTLDDWRAICRPHGVDIVGPALIVD